ncbi:hypothetical protein CYMTET_25156 [Cymbomonas tetramitiformis]|uniref:Uncharacterized protein n=1 Tax=Cymbomonas tetramitiformis TaxID=36881 RepID=A0AAE0FUR4_9CHLO|nr:hypothetical protein CYMTET_25156 [Cymbomonas tetramitiformis]
MSFAEKARSPQPPDAEAQLDWLERGKQIANSFLSKSGDVATFATEIDNARCPSDINGTWTQTKSSESLCPILRNLGVPGFVCPIIDRVHTTLDITCIDRQGDFNSERFKPKVRIQDRTIFGTNFTEVSLDGEELEKLTKGGRKRYMLSGYLEQREDNSSAVVMQCRLFQRGEGWYTRQERFVVKETGELHERHLLGSEA